MTSSERRQCERSTSELEGKAPPHCRQHRLQGFHLLFLRMTYEKLKTDVMRWKEEHRAITESRPQKDWKLSSLQHELEQMKSTRDSYQAEVGTDLLSQLSVNEQGEVDRLNDKIQDLTRRAKEAYRRRMRLESEKSQLETQLYHNLFRKREQLERDLNEVSETDLNEKFRDAEEELTSVEQRIKDFQVRGLNGGETPPRNKLYLFRFLFRTKWMRWKAGLATWFRSGADWSRSWRNTDGKRRSTWNACRKTNMLWRRCRRNRASC